MPAAIAIPIYSLSLSDDEKRSLDVVREVLGRHPRIFVAPDGLDIPEAFVRGEKIVRFPRRFFTYPHGYNRLLMTRRFFQAFAGFSHILVYQLDCLVFRDELLDWCAKDFDYIGSPWYENYIYAYQNSRKWWVGNGGFSLRRTAPALGILSTRVPRGSAFPVPPAHLPQPSGLAWFATSFLRRMKSALSLWTVEDELLNYGESEDRFWSLDARRFCPDFRVAPVDEAMLFSIEQFPETCVELNGGKIPFGCHAWPKYDREFWEKAVEHRTSNIYHLRNSLCEVYDSKAEKNHGRGSAI